MSVFFFKFYNGLSPLSSEIIENNWILFLNWRAKENLAMNNKDNRVLVSKPPVL